ncbi:MAG: hypothetical protein JW873_01660 [Candidatus Saganbacteria bacterium]|nr:hypothetical protein [Candidatus Saganbacteria bacterium]
MKIERHYEDFQKPDKIEQGGLLRLSGAFLLDHADELVNLIKHEGRLAEERNPAHKIIGIDQADGGIVATISDHNLALHIGKRLEHAYKGKHEFKFLKGEKYVEVLWRRDD